MSFVRQFAMERFLPEDIVDYAPGYKTALMGNARLYADDVLGAANPAHAYNAKRQLAEYGMQAKGIESRTPKNPNPFNQALGTAASVVGMATPFMGGGGGSVTSAHKGLGGFGPVASGDAYGAFLEGTAGTSGIGPFASGDIYGSFLSRN